MNRLFIAFTVFLYLIVLPDFAQTSPLTFWSLKPNLKADTIALINNQVKKINVYLLDNYIDSLPRKYFYGSWTITSETNKIVSSRWNWADSIGRPYWDFDVKFTTSKKSKRKITETSDKREFNKRELKMIHYLNSNNNVDKTTFYYLSSRYEDSYSLISRIKYKYNKGLLIEADYFNNWMFIDKNFCYLKYFFTYE